MPPTQRGRRGQERRGDEGSTGGGDEQDERGGRHDDTGEQHDPGVVARSAEPAGVTGTDHVEGQQAEGDDGQRLARRAQIAAVEVEGQRERRAR